MTQSYTSEHMKLYRSFREEVPEEEYTIDIGKANVKKKVMTFQSSHTVQWFKNQ